MNHSYSKFIPMKKILLLLLLSFTCSVLSASVYTVINTNASGAGSFLEAIDNANLNVGADNVEFNIPGMPPHVIQLDVTATISISDALIIDGTTQPDNGYSGNCPKITLDASMSDTSFYDLFAITAPNVSILGLALKKFSHLYSTAIAIYSGNVSIGAPGKKNTFNNLYNSISANTGDLQISSNYFGCNCDGDAVDANSGAAIVGYSAMNNVGITDNLISGNLDGINLGATVGSSDNVVIKGNKIGTDISGTSLLGNQGHGIQLRRMVNLVLGGAAIGEGNVVSGNKLDGCLLTACSGTVFGNFIGTDITGNDTLPNDPFHIQYSTAFNCIGYSNVTCSLTVGGFNPGEQNVIFANNIGLNIADSSGFYSVYNNIIGQTLSGLVSPNQNTGVEIYFDTNQVIVNNNYIYGENTSFFATQCRNFIASENIIGYDLNSNSLNSVKGFSVYTADSFSIVNNTIRNCQTALRYSDCNDSYTGHNQIMDCVTPAFFQVSNTTCHHNQLDQNPMSNNLNPINLRNGLSDAANDDILPPIIAGSNSDSTWGTSLPNALIDLCKDITLLPNSPQGFDYSIPRFSADPSGHWVYIGTLMNPNEYTAMQTDLYNNSSGFSQRLTLGIDRLVEDAFKLYPVPASDYLYIQTLDKNVMSEWEIFNSLGEVLKKGVYSGAANERIDIKFLPRGYYFVRVLTGEASSTFKCIKF